MVYGLRIVLLLSSYLLTPVPSVECCEPNDAGDNSRTMEALGREDGLIVHFRFGSSSSTGAGMMIGRFTTLAKLESLRVTSSSNRMRFDGMELRSASL